MGDLLQESSIQDDSRDFLTLTTPVNPVNVYMLQVNKRTLEKGVKYVQC